MLTRVYSYAFTKSTREKTFLGEREPPRVCRFCAGTTPASAFGQQKHILPAAFGNRTLFSHEECDACNAAGSELENDLASFLAIERAMARMRSRKGSVKDGILSEVEADKGAGCLYRNLRKVHAAVERYSMPGSSYRRETDTLLERFAKTGRMGPAFDQALAALMSIRADYAADRMRSVLEVVHASLFADFIEQAEHLRTTGFLVPAAVVAGSTLEAHLRQLCAKYAVPTQTPSGDPKKASALNVELRTAGAYPLSDDKHVSAWLGVRNDAAHGKPVVDGVVQLMIAGVRDFISRVPA